MFEQFKRNFYINTGYKEKDLIVGKPVKISIVEDWFTEQGGIDQSSYFSFQEKWSKRPDIMLLEEQNFMLLLVTVLNRIFDKPGEQVIELEFVSRYGYHMIVSFKKQHKGIQACDAEAVAIFLCHTMLKLTKNKYRIRVIFAEKKLAIEHFKEVIG